MAAKGTEAKNTIFNKLLTVFPGAFWEEPNKILRVPIDENGTRVEIKVTLTAAKTNLGTDEVASAFSVDKSDVDNDCHVLPNEKTVIEPTEEEKNNVKSLLDALNF